MDKKIYSLNLLAYILYITELEPEIDSIDGYVFYGVFPRCESVSMAISQFRSSYTKVAIHQYLAAYRRIREIIKDKRGV